MTSVYRAILRTANEITKKVLSHVHTNHTNAAPCRNEIFGVRLQGPSSETWPIPAGWMSNGQLNPDSYFCVIKCIGTSEASLYNLYTISFRFACFLCILRTANPLVNEERDKSRVRRTGHWYSIPLATTRSERKEIPPVNCGRAQHGYTNTGHAGHGSYAGQHAASTYFTFAYTH